MKEELKATPREWEGRKRTGSRVITYNRLRRGSPVTGAPTAPFPLHENPADGISEFRKDIAGVFSHPPNYGATNDDLASVEEVGFEDFAHLLHLGYQVNPKVSLPARAKLMNISNFIVRCGLDEECPDEVVRRELSDVPQLVLSKGPAIVPQVSAGCRIYRASPPDPRGRVRQAREEDRARSGG